MLLWSLIAREFRRSARKKRAHGLRLAFGAAMAAWGMFVALQLVMERTEGAGRIAYNAMVWPLAIGLALLAPALAAPSIATERREETLGLLFLTKLRSYHIVAAKFAACLLELLWFVLLVIPFLALPIWMGGVGHDEITGDALIILGIVVCSTAAGIFASAMFRSATVAYMAALGILIGLDGLLSLLPDSPLLVGIGGLALRFDRGIWRFDPIPSNYSIEGLIDLGLATFGALLLLALAVWRVAAISQHWAVGSSRSWRRRLQGLNRVGNWLAAVGACIWMIRPRPPLWDTDFEFLIPWTPLGCMLMLLIATAVGISKQKEAHTLESLVCTPLSNRFIANQNICEAIGTCWGWCILMISPQLWLFAISIVQWALDRGTSAASDVYSILHWTIIPISTVLATGTFCSAVAKTPMRAIASATIWITAVFCLGYFAQRHVDPTLQSSTIPAWTYSILWCLYPFALYFVLVRNLRRFAARQ